jgi:dTDP-glucose pyrophosphorylase
MPNIVIPMAGAGSRFARDGYTLPKPLIPVHGRPMLQWVIANMRPSQAHRFVFICQRRHAVDFDLHRLLTAWAPGCAVVMIDGLTQGAACTVLAARELIDSRVPLMIANSDQYVDVDLDAYVAAAHAPGVDGMIMTMHADDPKWSFVGRDAAGRVERVVEKQVVSNEATVGVYNFRHGSDFVAAADAMIAADDRVNGEFYVAPVYNRLIAQGRRIETFDVGAEGRGMYGLGTPADLRSFLELPLSRQRSRTLALGLVAA